MKPTEEQQEIVEAFASGEDMVIEAGAGVGKTSTLAMLGSSDLDRAGVYIAFNRAVASEARAKFPGSVNCATAHSLAFRAVGREYADRLSSNVARVTSRDVAEWLDLKRWFKVVGKGRKDISTWKLASLAREAVTRFCYSDDDVILGGHVPFVQGVDNMDELREEVLPLARQVWADVIADDGWLPVEHDHYMKLWAMTEPQLLCDYVMLDEAQDTNPVLAQVVKGQRDKQVVLVGDARQQLFEWRGARDIMSAFEGRRLYLTQSFRFGPQVAEEANRWLSYLEAPIRLRGTESIDSRLCHVDEPDAVLCRTNADVVDQAMRAQQAGVRVGVVGGTSEIVSFAQAAIQLQVEHKTSHRELSVFKSWGDAQAYLAEENPGGTFGTMMRLIDRYGAHRVVKVAEGCVPEGSADRVVATVHKVKGLEWDAVAVDGGVAPGEEDDPMDPSPASLMIAYVATTRAKFELDTSAIDYFHRHREFVAGQAARAQPI